MPAPSSPPPSDEAGAILSPRQLNRWLDVNPVSPLTRTQTYLTLPAFDAIFVQWKGYSELVGAFNFTAGRNFSLPQFIQPIEPDYLLCVSWFGLDGVVHRYKLWEDVGEVLFFDAPLYIGQLIKGNFRFEIWSVTPTDAQLEFVTVAGAGTVTNNQLYQNQHDLTWDGLSNNIFIVFNDTNNIWTLVSGLDIWYAYQSADGHQLLEEFPWFSWITTAGVNPPPYSFTASTAAQATSLSFTTSVRGNYDYMWQNDSTLALPSALVTDFNIEDNDAPWTTPGNSTSTVNNS